MEIGENRPNHNPREVVERWGGSDYATVIVASATSLCLVAIVGFILLGLRYHRLQLGELGKFEGLNKGEGLLGLVALLGLIAATIVGKKAGDRRDSSPEVGARRQGSRRTASILSILGTLGLAATSIAMTRELRNLEQRRAALQGKVDSLQSTQTGLLRFMGGISSKRAIRFIDSTVDWNAIVQGVTALPEGRRKATVLSAILLAWRDVSTTASQPSTELIRQILDSSGVHIDIPKDIPPSVAFEKFPKVPRDSAKPGDLVLYAGHARGDFRHFAVMYLGASRRGTTGVVLGSWEEKAPLQVIDAYYFERKPPVTDTFVGIFRPPYDAMSAVKR